MDRTCTAQGTIDDISCLRLVGAIIKQAVNDYKKALEERNERAIEEVERFFLSEDFMMFTDLCPKTLIRKLKLEVYGE